KASVEDVENENDVQPRRKGPRNPNRVLEDVDDEIDDSSEDEPEILKVFVPKKKGETKKKKAVDVNENESAEDELCMSQCPTRRIADY
ncbi:hypothetical protein H0H92_013048, partial [Tricholoma furcatifolium]